MIILDTDHVSFLDYPTNPHCVRLKARMAASSDQDFVTTIVTVEEHMRGWLAEIKRIRDFDQQISAYDRLLGLFNFFSRWRLLPFDGQAAHACKLLKKQKVRIGTMDLKIASIARVHNALLLSANLRDYRQVPELRVESWLD